MSAHRPASDPSPPAAPRGFSPLRLLRKLLFGHVQIERREGGLRVRLEERPRVPAATPPEPAAKDASPSAVAAVLRARLQAHADARRALPHLRYLSHALVRQGWEALRDLPEPTLKKMLAQLDVLMPPDPLLVQLETRLIAEQRERSTRAEQTLPFGLGPSDYRPGDKLHVDEAALSDFERAAGQAEQAEQDDLAEAEAALRAAYADTLPADIER